MPPGEVVTLKPNGSDELVIPVSRNPYGDRIILDDADWGDQPIDVSLATGPDVVGAVPGAVQRGPIESVLSIQIHGETGAEYVDAAFTLAKAWQALARNGGWVERQVTFGDGTVLPAVESEVVAASPFDPEEGYMQSDHRFGRVVLSLTRQPYWLAPEEQVATLTANTASIKSPTLAALKGNLPGPGRLVLKDNAGQARRFLEIGQAWTESAQTVEYTGADVNPGVGTTFGATVLLSPVVPAWQTVALLEDIPHRGSFRARVGARFPAAQEIEVRQRVQYRIGGGPWRSTDKLEVTLKTTTPTARYEQDHGSIHVYEEGALDVRVQVFSSAVDTTANIYIFDRLTLMPTERYCVVRGEKITGESGGMAAFEDFRSINAGALSGQTADYGGAFAETGDVSPQWTVLNAGDLGNYAYRSGTADASLNAGGFALLGTTVYSSIAVTAALRQRQPATTGAYTLSALVVRYVDTSNFVVVGLRGYRGSGYAPQSRILVRKVVAGSATDLALVDEVPAIAGDYMEGNLSFDCFADGTWELSVGRFSTSGEVSEVVASGSDSALATAGALDDGRIGVYHASTEANRTGSVHLISALTPATAEQQSVVRASGTGVHTHERTYSASATDTEAQPLTPQGARFWLPPGASQLALKLRRENLDSEPDSGTYTDSTDVTVYHRPAYATLPGEQLAEELVLI